MLSKATRSRGILAAALVAIAWGCEDQPAPTAVEVEPADEPALDTPTQVFGANAVFSDRAHALPPESFELLSSPAEIEAGSLRFRPTGGSLPEVLRDDFIVAPGPGGEMAVRRVLEASVVGGELSVETVPAYWHEVIRSGTYQVSIPFDGSEGATFQAPGPLGAPVRIGADNLDLPSLEREWDNTDVCAWIEDLLNRFGSQERQVCGKPVSLEVGAGVTVGIEGTLDSLRILDGRVRVSGQTDLALTVESGGISGGRRPTFAPCNRANYRGCLTTPTGAALVDFLRRYAPQIPNGSLAPNRVCIPGTPIRVRSGYWSGFRYTPPVYEICRVTDFGELPTVTLPSIQAVTNEIRPRIDGHMTVRVIGDGAITLKLPVPSLAASASYQVTNDLKAKASIGLFVTMKASILNGGGTVRFTFDDTGRVTQTWTSTQGWDGDFGIIEKENHAELLDITNPDSVVIRLGVPVEVNAEVCIALYGCLDKLNDDDDFTSDGSLGDRLFGELNLGAKAGASVSLFEDVVWTREQVHPTDPDVDNWHIDVTAGYDLTLKAGVTIPLTGWIAPSVPRGFDKTWECCRVSISDYYGQGRLQVTTATTGVDLDSDGYTVLVERADTLPPVLDAGATRIGPGWPTKVFDEPIGRDGSVMFGYPSVLPCIAVYSDAYLIGNPVWGLSLAAARSAGLNIPNFGATSPCRWLIARYKVTLSGVASNCSVVGGAVRNDVWLQQSRFNPTRSNIKDLHFDVVCSASVPSGSLEVTIPPGHRGSEAPPYLLLDGVTAGVFTDSDVLTLTGLAPASYDLELLGVASNCVSPALTIDVVAGQTTQAAPQVICALPSVPPGTVTYSATTTGGPADPNGFGLIRDGEPVANVPSSGTGAVQGLAASEPTVLFVTDIAGNCQPQALNPRVVTLDAARTSQTIDFPVVCHAAPVDTIIGRLDSSGWPIPTVTMRANDGRTLVVSGPKTSELARLTGTPVRVWGQASATGLSVNGYDLRSSLGDDRWLGIVLVRPGGTWLFGEEDIRLVNPPAGLVAADGNLVWVMGKEVNGGVQPTLYGVIRGGS